MWLTGERAVVGVDGMNVKRQYSYRKVLEDQR
jgi:hypothetical protein